MFFEMTLKSMMRRKKELRFVSAVTLIAVFFLSGVSVFQNVMNRYVREMNYENYGEWVISRTAGEGEVEHPYITEKGIAKSGGSLLLKPGDMSTQSGDCVGTVDEAFMETGHVSMYEGRMPENDGETAMDLPTLAAMGYGYDLGQTVTLSVVKDEEGNIATEEFKLVGTYKSFATNWAQDKSSPLPSVTLTEEGLNKLGGAFYSTQFYQLDRKYEEIDTEEFADSLKDQGIQCTYNAPVYETRLWGSVEMFNAVKLILLAVGAIATGYLLISYESGRRRWYYQYRTIGAGRGQIRRMILIEGCFGVFPYALAGLVLPQILGAVVCAAVSGAGKIPYLYRFEAGEFFVQAGVVFGVLFLVILSTWIVSGDRALIRNTRELTERQIRRLRGRKKKNLLRDFYPRQRKMQPLRQAAAAVFSVAVCMVMILCVREIAFQITAYVHNEEYVTDCAAERMAAYEYTVASVYYKDGVEVVDEDSAVQGYQFYNMYDGLSEGETSEIKEMAGVGIMSAETMDERHLLMWDGRTGNALLQSFKDMEYDDERTCPFRTLEEYPCEKYYFYEDYDQAAAEEGIRATGEAFDEERFNRGEQVIIICGTLVLEQEPEVEEYGIREGQELQIISRDHNNAEPVEVTAGMVFTPQTSRQRLDFPEPYNIIASRALAEKMAAADGQELKVNSVKIDFNRYASFESTEKQLAALFAGKGMDYYSNLEMLQAVRDEFIRGVSIYGIFLIVGISVYIILQLNIRRNQGYYLTGKYRSLRRMGMEKKRFRALALTDGSRQAVWLVLAVPCVYALSFVQGYFNAVKDIAGMDPMDPNQVIPDNPFGYTFSYMSIKSAPVWEISMCAAMILMFVACCVHGVRSIEKGERKV